MTAHIKGLLQVVLSPQSSVPFEFGVITLIGLLYFSFITPPPQVSTSVTDHLDITPLARTLLDPDIRQSGLEHERLAGVILPVKIGLERYGRIPTWNPYIGTGEPIINNAFSYLFNPFHSLPILLLGGVQGSKVATFIAILIAGYSMWAFARALGLGDDWRRRVKLRWHGRGSRPFWLASGRELSITTQRREHRRTRRWHGRGFGFWKSNRCRHLPGYYSKCRWV